MKVFALVLVTALTLGACNAVKLRKIEKNASLQEEQSSNTNEDEPINKSERNGDKEVHKRGVFHYGTLAGQSVWPKAYAAHYGYGGLHVPALSTFAPASGLSAAHLAVPGPLRYNTGFHYKTLASPLASFGATSSAATPYIIRPGGAIVQSYNINYPHHRSPVTFKTYAAAPPAPVHVYQNVLPAVQSFETVQPAAPVQPVPVQPTVPVHVPAPVQPVPVQPVPVQPVPVQHVPSVVQTTFVQQSPPQVIPQVPAPAPPVFPISAFNPPSVPAVTPTIPNNFFPVNIQPPVVQNPTTFVTQQVPTFVQVPNTPNQGRPEFGSADAAPQIPQPTPEPHFEPELPQQQPTQQPWKPVLYLPPNVENEANRPSNTLLPPYGNSPNEGYLPPAPSSNQKQINDEFTANRHYYDNLSDAEIQHIFHQANLAAHSERSHAHDHAHTVHTYHSPY
ncbi:uncharacterized protein LOC142229812 isoform X2 [Haematobia irritans]|uniref:uncharacterized protein LOC142229812 isoform X2 n=1 Tax=Haematobia irritans TaxID=7368 RepID=UPI003F50A8D6